MHINVSFQVVLPSAPEPKGHSPAAEPGDGEEKPGPHDGAGLLGSAIRLANTATNLGQLIGLF